MDYKSTLDAALNIYRTEGFLALYSGLTPALLGATQLAIQFPLYEKLKRYFTGVGLGGWKEGSSSRQVPGILLSSCLSKICAGAITYPHEVIRTRLQMQMTQRAGKTWEGQSSSDSEKVLDTTRQRRGMSRVVSKLRKLSTLSYEGTFNTLRILLREEGWRALYAGMGTSMVRAIPSSATTIFAYEVLVQELKKSKNRGQRKLAHRYVA